MADRPRRRNGAPGKIPLALLSPRRTTRSTRSQSQSHQVIVEKAPRRVDEYAPVSDVQQSIGEDDSSDRTSEQDSAEETEKEEDAAMQELSEENQNPAGIQRNKLTTDSGSPGATSAFSGTTARVSGSARDFADHSYENLILEALPDLWESSVKLLRFLLPNNSSTEGRERIWRFVQDGLQSRASKQQTQYAESSRVIMNLMRHRKALQIQVDYCNPEGGELAFIPVGSTLSSLYTTERILDVLDETTRPDALFMAGNLAVLTERAMSYNPERDSEFFIELDAAFPQEFSNIDPEDMEIGPDQALSSTLLLALQFRTQRAISELKKNRTQPSFDQDLILHQVFYDGERAIRGWECRGLNSHELSEATKAVILSRLKEIRSITQAMSSESERAEALDRLQTMFDWNSCISDTLIWIDQQFRRNESKVRSGGGALEIVQTMQEAILSREPMTERNPRHESRTSGSLQGHLAPAVTQEAGILPSSDGGEMEPQLRAKEFRSPRFSANSAQSRQGANSLRKRSALRAAAKAGKAAEIQAHVQPHPVASASSTKEHRPEAKSPTRSPNLPSFTPNQVHYVAGDEADDWRPEQNEDDIRGPDTLSDQPDLPDKILDERDRDLAESNKENRAQIMLPSLVETKAPRLIDAQPDAQRVSWGSSEISVSSTEANTISQLSRDQGFQQSQHRPNVGPLRARERRPPSPPYTARKRPAKRRREEQSSPPRNRRAISSDVEVIEGQPIHSQSVRVVQTATRAARNIVAMSNSKVAQSRKPWGEDETEFLIDAIGRFGCKWSLLKSMDHDGILKARDQVALKDKARNLKMIFLKSSRRLPPNFQYVAIPQYQINNLEGLGILYDKVTGRREDAE